MNTHNETTTQATTERQEAARARRAALRDLSQSLKQLAAATGDERNVNELLRDYYAAGGHDTLKTFDEWKKAGYYVRKGEKALLFWGRPKNTKKADEANTPEEATDEEKADFFPLCYLFSSNQVAPRK